MDMKVGQLSGVETQLTTGTKSKKSRYRVQDLLRGADCVRLVHGNSEYELRVTRNGKLILTK